MAEQLVCSERWLEPVEDVDLRHVLGHFCSGVTVVTGHHDGEPVGFSCQSFASLSLDPPLVLFTASLVSRTLPRLQQAGTIAVNVLAEDQEELSRRFARSGTDKFAGLSWQRGPEGVPLLDDTVATMVCRLEAEHPAGDHVILVARILTTSVTGNRRPLLFFRSQYRSLDAQRLDV